MRRNRPVEQTAVTMDEAVLQFRESIKGEKQKQERAAMTAGAVTLPP